MKTKTIVRVLVIIDIILFSYLFYSTLVSYWLEPAYGKPVSISVIGNFILFLTFIAITCYTAEVFYSNTLKIREISISTRPRIDIYFRGGGGVIPMSKITGKFALRNSSNVTAYNIKVENINLGNFVYKFYFKQMDNILEYGGDEKRLEIYTELKSGGVIMHDENDFWQEVLKNIKPVPFYFTYENIEKEKFYTLFILYYKHNPIGGPCLAFDPTIEYIKSAEGKLNKKKIKKPTQKPGLYETKYSRHEKQNKFRISRLFSKIKK